MVADICFSGFDWDSGNSEKCKKHGVSRAEIEDLFLNNDCYLGKDEKHSVYESRLFIVGKCKAGRRYIYVIFTLRKQHNKTLIRPISARYMHKKEIESYEEAFAKIKKR